MRRKDAVTLRPARESDIEGVANLFLACWRTSYQGVLPTRLVAMFEPGSARDLWRRSLAEGTADRDVVVAERPDQSIVGVISHGLDRDVANAGHIFSLYVHPNAQGLGIGRTLVTTAMASFRAAGHTLATLWVFEANAGGRAFYERLGWLPDGTVRVEPEYGEPELRLSCAVFATD